MSNIQIPCRAIGPIKMFGDLINGEIRVPLATYETTLWPSASRGAKVSRLTSGINVTLIDERMTRSVTIEGKNASELVKLKSDLITRKSELNKVVATTSRFAKLIDMNFQIVGKLIYIRFEFLTGDASGHNMTTKASDALVNWICSKYNNIKYISISGNTCTDKKTSAINGILGRGKNIVAEIEISREICESVLKTTPEKIVELNIKKNLLGSILAGSIRSANAHFANILLAFYLATGQDGANVVEGSQGITFAELTNNGSLYFSITCPNIIVGTVGNGKGLDFVENNLQNMGCLDGSLSIGENSRRLAGIIVATVLCSELSLLAAQTNQGELMRAHESIERKK